MDTNNRHIRRDYRGLKKDIADVDYGYRYFWRRRGISPPPPVSSCWIDADLSCLQDDVYVIYEEVLPEFVNE